MVIGRNKRKLNQKVFYLDKDHIEITHEYKYLGIDLYSHGYFEPSSKRRGIADMRALMKHMTAQPHKKQDMLISKRFFLPKSVTLSISLGRN